ncbi:hypothetical protein Mtc_1654 [Methanocella conradii HZ254]|uniref:DUF86 domain-containing protein n=1 Tax=Methanocella conradii (strain DSM 24694 / JCM 17849 / CGMCC 1.5162 / HZ254) TaxID=1041930 RepID=H8I803_METCZ|nr:HepT-like ribonuclease domain-containing protein [Methanocella conradii]AFD00403.1 hypothetical protein Mtc_1654 [Methanocella conradii HZ254]
MKVVESIMRFERHLNGALSLKDKNLSDYLVYNTIAMECFQAISSLIEIGEHVVAKNNMGFPSTYGEVFKLLYRNGAITKEEFDASLRLVFLRNLIAHEYYRIEEKELSEMIYLLEKMKKFVEKEKSSG